MTSERIIRVPCGSPLPFGFVFKAWLGTETGLYYGATSNYKADVILASFTPIDEMKEHNRPDDNADVRRAAGAMGPYGDASCPPDTMAGERR